MLKRKGTYRFAVITQIAQMKSDFSDKIRKENQNNLFHLVNRPNGACWKETYRFAVITQIEQISQIRIDYSWFIRKRIGTDISINDERIGFVHVWMVFSVWTTVAAQIVLRKLCCKCSAFFFYPQTFPSFSAQPLLPPLPPPPSFSFSHTASRWLRRLRRLRRW